MAFTAPREEPSALRALAVALTESPASSRKENPLHCTSREFPQEPEEREAMRTAFIL
jgi:hypothetical protein